MAGSEQIAALCIVSLGMIVLDELRFPDRETLKDVVDGPGANGKYICLVHDRRTMTHASYHRRSYGGRRSILDISGMHYPPGRKFRCCDTG